MKLEKENDPKCQEGVIDSYFNCDFKNRKIYIRGEITPFIDIHFSMAVDKMRGSKGPIVIDLNSVGGYFMNCLGVYNKMRNACPIVTTTFGHVGSGALLIFLGGDERLISRKAIIRFHWPVEISNNEELNPDSTETNRDYYKKVFDHYCKIIAGRAGLRPQAVKEYMRYSRAFDGEKAREMGVATRLIEEDIYRKRREGRK